MELGLEKVSQNDCSVWSTTFSSATKPLTVVSFVLLTLLAGCDGNQPYDLVPVSGVITLEGQPLADATVKFAPRGGMGKELVGPGSIGTTDENGKYELRTYKEEPGAVVGLHIVKISTFRQEFVDIRKSDEVRLVSEEKVPNHYNRKTILSFEVPPEGTDEANFVLTLKKPD